MDDDFEFSGRPLSCTLTVSGMDRDFLTRAAYIALCTNCSRDGY